MKDYTIYVTEEIAKKAMEKGFEFTASDEYDDEETTFNIGNHPICDWVKLPTAEQICGWLREEKKIQVDVSYRSRYENTSGKADFADWYYVVRGINLYQIIEDTEFSSYKEALLEAINRALDLI